MIRALVLILSMSFLACKSGDGDPQTSGSVQYYETNDLDLAGRTGHSLCYYNGEAYIWGGEGISANTNELVAFDDGASLNLETLELTLTTEDEKKPTARHSHQCVSGDVLIQWGGRTASGVNIRNGAFYDAIADNWTEMSLTDTHSQGYDISLVKIENSVVAWGGGPAGVQTGAVYDLENNSWSATSTNNAPTARTYHSTVSTDSEMIVWGGLSAGEVTDTGGIYDPLSNTWTEVEAVNAPSPRQKHQAVWTGEYMIVWGGIDEEEEFLADGGLYNPVTNTWSEMATSIIAGRYNHVSVYTGEYMVVWGGQAKEPFGDGAIYDVDQDAWGALTDFGLTPRIGHQAIWTGEKLFLWGGWDSRFAKFGSEDESKYRRNGVIVTF